MKDPKDVVRAGIDRWNAHDRAGFLALHDPRVKFLDLASGLEANGLDEFGASFYDLWMKAYPDNRITTRVVFAEGGIACFEGHFIGTHTGVLRTPDMEFPPTGKPVNTSFVYIVEITNEKVSSVRMIYDRLSTLVQEGVVDLEQLTTVMK